MANETTNTTLVLPGTVYDFLKKLAQLWLPAVATLYFALAAIWGLPAADKVVGSITALDAFLGVMLNISKNQYVASGAAYDGHITVTPNDEGTAVKLSVNPDDLVGKSVINLKVASNPPPVS